MTPFAEVFFALTDDPMIDAVLQGETIPCEEIFREASILLALSSMGFLGELTPPQELRLRALGADLDAGVALVPLDPARRRRLLATVAAGRQAVIRDLELDEDELPTVTGFAGDLAPLTE